MMPDETSSEITIDKLFLYQEVCVGENVARFRKEFDWCGRALALIQEVQVILSEGTVIDWRRQQQDTDKSAFDCMCIVLDLLNSALGSLINALRLAIYGAIADSGTLIRIAFETTCYADFFVRKPEKVSGYLRILEKLKTDPTDRIDNMMRDEGISFGKVRNTLEECDPQDRKIFYSFLSGLGHPSPIRIEAGLTAYRTADGRPDLHRERVGSFYSEKHRLLEGLVSLLVQVIKYALDIQMRTWPDFIGQRLSERYRILGQEFSELPKPDKSAS